MQQIDLLVLGAGWTSTFLTPLLDSSPYSYILTSTTGRPGTIKFSFDPSLPSQSYFSTLPSARYILLTFPVRSAAHASLLLSAYGETHPRTPKPRFIVLGSTGIYPDGGPTLLTADDGVKWVTRHSGYDRTNPRAVGEDTFIAEGGAAVLNLSGLWDGVTRIPRRWVGRVAKDKAAVAGKGSLHLVHGLDVARGIMGVIEAWEEDGEESERCRGQRWMLTDGFVYDWWALIAGWADIDENGEKSDSPSEQAKWAAELIRENGVRALPRNMKLLGRCYDSREFWETFKVVPLKARVT